jgi:hypothetical protein
MTIRPDPFYRQAKAHRTLDDAFHGVEYAHWYEQGERSYAPTPLFTVALTVLGFCAMIIAWFKYT